MNFDLPRWGRWKQTSSAKKSGWFGHIYNMYSKQINGNQKDLSIAKRKIKNSKPSIQCRSQEKPTLIYQLHKECTVFNNMPLMEGELKGVEKGEKTQQQTNRLFKPISSLTLSFPHPQNKCFRLHTHTRDNYTYHIAIFVLIKGHNKSGLNDQETLEIFLHQNSGSWKWLS